MKSLSITILHKIQGRVRIGLSNPPINVEKFMNHVKKHEGIDIIKFNHISKSLLVCYNPTVISFIEIIMRSSIALSLEYENSPVIIQNNCDKRPMTTMDYYSGASILGLLASKGLILGDSTNKIIEYNAGISTTIAVLNHAWSEVQRKGIYDPEVVSVVYLLRALINGNILTASTITWLATFGRHLFEFPTERFVLTTTEIKKSDGKDFYIDVTLKPLIRKDYSSNPLRIVIVGLGKIIGISEKNHTTLLDQIKLMAKKHGNILEGVNNKHESVYMRIEY